MTDATGAVIGGVTLELTEAAEHTVYHARTDRQGSFAFPNLPVGHYELAASAVGFASQRRAALAVDADSALRIDIVLAAGAQGDTVTVTADTGIQVETAATHLGEVISAAQMEALPLNGRSYTDLLAIQPGVAPISTLTASSVIMAGVTGSLDPSGDLNPGNLSINGQRESSNGFLVDGIDVQEPMNGGTAVIPNLDSIEEFRVLTNNFDPEYGNYNGGMITVVTRQGGNALHGSAFEFFRNTALDARGYFDLSRAAFKQNQYGGTIGGPVRREKVFFFADYQGTRTTQGISTGKISVLSTAQRTGDFSSATSLPLAGCVSGPYLAGVLTQELGQSVQAGDPYSTQASNCTAGRPAVFGAGLIPQAVWSAPAKKLLPYIPAPNTLDSNGILDEYTTSAFAETVRDDKGSFRVDSNSRFGRISAYYFVDDYKLDNPYPGAVAGASIPGFDALFIGRAQLFSLGDNQVIGLNTVNEFHIGYLRNANVVGQPKGGLGVTLASQGFVTGAGTPGIVVQDPQFEGVQNIAFPSFTMGVPITNETQINNTYNVSDGLSRAIGAHTLKVGAQFRIDQVNEHPNGIFNGTFNIDGTETGNPFADLLLGTPSSFQQSAGPPFYLRNRYFGAYVQDSWRARHDLTINAGLRWDVIMPFWEKYNHIQTYVPGQQSLLFPGAPTGVVVPGDPGIPSTIAPTQYRNFAPRVGIAYAPSFHGGGWDHGIGRAIFGGAGKGSLRASYGIFYTQFPGILTGIMYAVPPYGYTYISPAPPLLATPFITAASGANVGQRFPITFPPNNVSASHPDNAVDWADVLPFESDPFFDVHNRVPYTDNYMLSFQRQISESALLTVSYVGNQGHRIPTVVPANLGNPALCLSLQSAGCGPFGEDTAYVNGAGKTVQGTRVGQGPQFGENTADSTVANSNFNALEGTLRYRHAGSELLLSYTYAKSIDQGSNIGEQFDPLNPRQSRTISAWDQKHTFVATYTALLPLPQMLHRRNRLTKEWTISGNTRFATGFPVTLYDNSDNSLLGTLGNGVNNYLLDTPRRLPGALEINTNPRNGRAAFNTALFPEEIVGQLGNAKRRDFYGPGIENFDLTLQKGVPLTGARSMDFRLEAFNVGNHAQFYGPAAVDGQVEDPNYGHIVNAVAPRLVQVVAKFSF